MTSCKQRPAVDSEERERKRREGDTYMASSIFVNVVSACSK